MKQRWLDYTPEQKLSRAKWRRTKGRKARLRKHYADNYGMTLLDYAVKAVQQENRCAICDEEAKEALLHVDHDHTTGKVRDLLCSNCNLILGLYRDRPRLFKQAAGYLELHGASNG